MFLLASDLKLPLLRIADLLPLLPAFLLASSPKHVFDRFQETCACVVLIMIQPSTRCINLIRAGHENDDH